jgi:hypothetical protein
VTPARLTRLAGVCCLLLLAHCGGPKVDARLPIAPGSPDPAAELEAARTFEARAMQTLRPYDQRYVEAFPESEPVLAATSTAAIDRAVSEGLVVSVWGGRLMPFAVEALRAVILSLQRESTAIAAGKHPTAKGIGKRWSRWLTTELERTLVEQQGPGALPALLRIATSTMLATKSAPSPMEEAAFAERVGKLEDRLATCDTEDARLIGAALTGLGRVLRDRPAPTVERSVVSLELALANCASKVRTKPAVVSPEQVATWTAARNKLRAGVLLGQNMAVSSVALPLKACLESARASTWVALRDELPTPQGSSECMHSADPIGRALFQHELLTLGLWLTGTEGGASLLSKADAQELNVLVHTYPDRVRSLAALAARHLHE